MIRSFLSFMMCLSTGAAFLAASKSCFRTDSTVSLASIANRREWLESWMEGSLVSVAGLMSLVAFPNEPALASGGATAGRYT
jgi:hypothetical protein